MLLKHLLKGEGGAAERTAPAVASRAVAEVGACDGEEQLGLRQRGRFLQTADADSFEEM